MSHTGLVRRWLVGALLGLALLPQAAWAQDPGVEIDPDSPSGREYDIPLESARRDAQPGREHGAPVEQGERESPLFGAGITPKQPSGGKPAAGKAKRPEPAPQRDATPAPRREVPAAVRAAATNPGAPAGGLGTTALVILGGVLVLGVGVGAGLLARRATRS